MYFLRAASISSGFALLTAAKNLSTFVEVAAWATCTFATTKRRESTEITIDLLLVTKDIFTLESNL
jgi:hypothetical protein